MNPILIVDDEKDNLDALTRLFRGKYDVTTTVSPFEALKLVIQKKFHVIISDQRMPEMTGVELLEKIKQISPQTTRILLTGYTDIESVIEAINRGNIYRYVAKPWDSEDFKITVKQADDNFLIRSELEKKNLDLAKALEELKTLDNMKSRFLSLVSHELNTPLTTLQSFQTLLEESQSQLEEDTKKAVKAIGGATQRLNEIVSEVIEFLKIESTASLNLTEESLEKVLKTTFDTLSIKPTLTIQNPTSVFLDKALWTLGIHKILLEVVSLAKPNNSIKVECHSEASDIIIKILWQGDRISEEAFSPLEFSSSILHHQKNLGLKLATAKTIILKHHGTIESSNDISGISIRQPKKIE